MKAIISILFLISSCIASFAGTIDEANKLYSDENYTEAAKAYENILSQGQESYELYYNLGNAYFKSNILPKAILNYERALLLTNNDEDVIYNLQIANSYIIDKIEVLDEFFMRTWYNSIISVLPVETWGVISIISFILTLLVALLFLFTKKSPVKKACFGIGLISVFITIISLVFGYSQYHKQTKRVNAIVMSPTVTGKSTPDESGTDLFIIHEGLKVSVTDNLGDWVEVKLSNGSKGWVLESSVDNI